MLTHQVPWLPSMGWCHFRWHHHAVYVCLCPPPHTHHHHHHSSSSFSSSCSPPSVSFLRGKVLFDTHPLYPDHRPNCLASTSGEGGRGRENGGEIDRDCQEGRNIYTKREASSSSEQSWRDLRAAKEVWRCGGDWGRGCAPRGQLSLITQHYCYHNTTKPEQTLSLRLKLVHGGVPQTVWVLLGTIVCC